MVELRRIKLDQLDPTRNAFYQNLVVPQSRFFFTRRSNYLLSIGVEAVEDDQVVGFAYAVCEYDRTKGRLASVCVLEAFRNQKIGSALVAYVEKELILEGCEAICTEFPEDDPTGGYFEKILQKDGWNTPSVYMLSCDIDIQKFHPPWFDRTYPLPDTFEEFMWKDLKESERARLKYLQNQRTFHYSVSPFVDKQNIELLNSLGLRHNGEVVGWMVTHRIAPDAIFYTSLYIHREYHHSTAYAIRLLIDAIRLQQQSDVPLAQFHVNLNLVDRSWYRFVKRRLLPYVQRVHKIKFAWRQLL